jgi:azurin
MKTILATLFTCSLTAFSFAGEVKIEITANDQMQYSSKTMEAKVGDTLIITLKNIGKLPKVAMGHNLAFLKPGTVLPTFATKCMTAGASDYIPADPESKALVVAHTKMLGGGESDTITFEAKEAGSYPYLCTFPGHFAIMNGVLTIK